MNYLCVETSQSSGFIALFHNQKKDLIYQWNERLHSEKILDSLKILYPLLDSSIDFIAINIGPGRFTGIRSGVNFAKVLSYYLKCSLYPFNSLRIIAENQLCQQKEPVVSILEAFGQMYYVGIYQKINSQITTLLSPQALSLEQLRQHISHPMVGVGDIFHKTEFSQSPLKSLKLRESILITPQLFSRYIKTYWDKTNLKSWKEVEPCYLRLPTVINKNI